VSSNLESEQDDIENRQLRVGDHASFERHRPDSAVFLMYHELQAPDRELCQNDLGYARYVISTADFAAQLGLLRDHGFRGLNLSEALAGETPVTDVAPRSNAPTVVFTFDDGCETDLLYAAPLLKAHGFGATFFLVAGHLGQRGSLTKEQARALSGTRFEVGCHSMTHADLTRLAPAALRTEIVSAKNELEQIIGRRVDHFSCPGGRWNQAVARAAQQAGYRTVCTSRIGVYSPGSDRYCLNRVAVLRGESHFLQLCYGRGLGMRRLRQGARSTVRSVVGETGYQRLRAALLR
jgi:peptidoglycan/xylan/chitin deacetylase (PgdA/CDA1 family)